MTKTVVKRVAMTKKVREFVVLKMSEGLTIAQIHSKYPDQCPAPNSIYRKSTNDDDWKEALDQGYTLWHYNKLEELDRLSTGLASEIYPGVEFREAEAALKRRIDTLKFSLGKMAPIMSKRFDKATKVEIEGNVGPTINVLSYALPANATIEKQVNNLIDQDVKDD